MLTSTVLSFRSTRAAHINKQLHRVASCLAILQSASSTSCAHPVIALIIILILQAKQRLFLLTSKLRASEWKIDTSSQEIVNNKHSVQKSVIVHVRLFRLIT